MKKIIVILIAVVAFTACKKPAASDTATTVNLSVAANQSYQYYLGKVNPSDVIITTAATHASASKVAFIRPTSDSTVYVFVPDTNYTGADQVVISLHGDHHCDHKCDHHSKGNCKNKSHDDDHDGAKTKYILNFNVTGTKASK